MEITSSISDNQTGGMEIVQATLLKKALKTEQMQQETLLQSADMSLGNGDPLAKIGRFLDVKV